LSNANRSAGDNDEDADDDDDDVADVEFGRISSGFLSTHKKTN